MIAYKIEASKPLKLCSLYLAMTENETKKKKKIRVESRYASDLALFPCCKKGGYWLWANILSGLEGAMVVWLYR